ncbi:LytR/AlgR family response regulator transcription factor [Roseivirga misakiensis]|uniref:DNA-binding response regulator n=1 Tax=Roseivirga misakiensis TaxID=1563681 RepID=A0A1E5T751_9BACT|nr:LytTR family DNA-binding domain-containing protein [Roseivirga misakiensis]OEK07199.1 hypothetical protein BFP71_05975 [Roseivirga misakiensis]
MISELRAIIVEDNAKSTERLEKYLVTYCKEIELVGKSATIKEAIELIQKEKPEAVFLDIELADGTAFDLLERISKPDFRIIFTTAHEAYAVKAIKHSAIDFLLKPIDPDELILAVDRARMEIEQELELKKVKHLLQVIDATDSTIPTLLLRDQYGIQLVHISEIIRLEGQGNYTKIIQKDQPPFMSTKVLKEIVSLLPDELFFRSHQSHVVNLNYVNRYDNRDSDLLFLRNGEKVPLATRRKQHLLKRLRSFRT